MVTAAAPGPVPAQGDALNQLVMNPNVNTALPGCLGTGITSKRPTGLGTTHTGGFYFDTTLGLPVWWTGSAWHNGAGAAA